MSRTTILDTNIDVFDTENIAFPPFYDLPKTGDFDFILVRIDSTSVPAILYEVTELGGASLNKNFKYATETSSYGSVELWVDGFYSSNLFIIKDRGNLSAFTRSGVTLSNLSVNTAVSFQLADNLRVKGYTVPSSLVRPDGSPDPTVRGYVQFAYLVKLVPNVQIRFLIIT